MAEEPTSIYRFAEVAFALIPATIEALITDEKIDEHQWALAATLFDQCRDEGAALAESKSGHQLSLLGAVARLLSSPSSKEICDLKARLPEDSSTEELVDIFAKAVVASETSKFSGPAQASALYGLADALYRLIPHYARDRNAVGDAFRRIVTIHRRLVEMHLGHEEYGDAIGPCTNLVALSDILAKQYGDTEAAKDALRTSRLVVEANQSAGEPNALSLAALCNNLIGMCKWLAKQETAFYGAYNADALDFAYRLKELLDSAERSAQKDCVIRLKESCLVNLAELHASFAVYDQEQFDMNAKSARQFTNELHVLASSLGDQDVVLRSREVKLRVEEILRSVQPIQESVASPLEQTSSEARSQRETLADVVSAFQRRAEEVGAAIITQNDDRAQQTLLSQSLEEWHGELMVELKRIIAEVGLNHHVCRILLALGALSSGKFGKTASAALATWLLRSESPEVSDSPYRRAEQSRQQLWAKERWEAEARVYAILHGLAALAEKLCEFPNLKAKLQQLQRRENSALVGRAIKSWKGIRLMSQPSRSVAEDLQGAASFIPSVFRQNLISIHASGLLTDEDTLQHGDVAYPDLRIVRPRGPRSGPTDKAAMNGAELIQHAEELAKKGWDALPKFDMEVVDTPEQQSASSAADQTDTHIGRTYRRGGKLLRIERILGKGRRKTVYELLDPESGERKALAVFNSAESTKNALMSRLNELLNDFGGHINEIAEVCDQLLGIDPSNDVALFNKGVALMTKGNLDDALHCFDEAIASSPDDVLNWIHKAATLAYLQRYSEALSHCSRSAKINREETVKYLKALPWIADLISNAAQTVQKTEPSRLDVERILALLTEAT